MRRRLKFRSDELTFGLLCRRTVACEGQMAGRIGAYQRWKRARGIVHGRGV